MLLCRIISFLHEDTLCLLCETVALAEATTKKAVSASNHRRFSANLPQHLSFGFASDLLQICFWFVEPNSACHHFEQIVLTFDLRIPFGKYRRYHRTRHILSCHYFAFFLTNVSPRSLGRSVWQPLYSGCFEGKPIYCWFPAPSVRTGPDWTFWT